MLLINLVLTLSKLIKISADKEELGPRLCWNRVCFMRKYIGEFKLSQYTSHGIWNEKLKKTFCKGHLLGLCKNYFLYPVRLIFQVRCINCFVFILPQAGDTLLKLSLRHLANVNQLWAETSQITDWILNRKTDQVMIAARTRPLVQVPNRKWKWKELPVL